MDEKYIRVGVYLSQNQYRLLRSKLVLEGNNISSKFREWIDKYLDKELTSMGPIRKTYHGTGKDLYAVPSKRKINANGLCDHFIAENGYCAKCEEI